MPYGRTGYRCSSQACRLLAPYRPHQGIAQHVPDDEPDAPRAIVTDIDTQRVRRKPVLSGLINEYTHAA